MFHLADGASTFGVTMAGGRHAFVPRFEPVEVLQTIARAWADDRQRVVKSAAALVDELRRVGEGRLITTGSSTVAGADALAVGVRQFQMAFVQILQRVERLALHFSRNATRIGERQNWRPCALKSNALINRRQKTASPIPCAAAGPAG